MRKRFPNGMRANGADALRCALLAYDLTKPVLRVDFTLPLSEARTLCSRVWNACRYAQRVQEAASADAEQPDDDAELGEAEEVKEFNKRARLIIIKKLHIFYGKKKTHLFSQKRTPSYGDNWRSPLANTMSICSDWSWTARYSRCERSSITSTVSIWCVSKIF